METVTPTEDQTAPAPTGEPGPGKAKRIGRVQIGFNVLIQVLLILFLLLAANYLGFSHYKRWDMSRDQKYALSDKTKRFLGTLKSNMRITNFFPPETPISPDVSNLLTEYQYAGHGKIDIETIDAKRSLSRAKEVFDKYKVIADEPLLVLDYEGRSKTVKASEMAEIDNAGDMFGEGPRVAAFKGEQAVTSAMIDLVEGKKNVIGYITGHKEPSIAESPTPAPMMMPQQPQTPPSPISVLKTFVENENIKMRELNLLNEPQVPADIKTVMLLGPQYDLSDREMKLLRDFWEKQGRILVLIDPTAKTPKLNALLADIGAKVNDDRLFAFVQTGIQEIAVTRDVEGKFLGESPVTKQLVGTRVILPGGTSSLSVNPTPDRTSNIHVQPLVQARLGYFAEKDYNTEDQAKLQADATAAPKTPITVAVAIEKGGAGDERVQMNSSRMVVVTNAAFVQDAVVTEDQQALDFVSGALNWLLNREQFIGIAPKVATPLTFNLSPDALRAVRWIILALFPLIPAVIGASVWWQRRA